MNYEELKEWNSKLTRMLDEPEEVRGFGWQMMIGDHLEMLVDNWNGIRRPK
jgi:hypothetical protein